MNVKSVVYRRWILSAVCCTLLGLAYANLTIAQDEPTESRNWWNPSEDGTREAGKLSDLINKKRVYIITSFTDSRTISEPPATHSGDVHRMVLDAFSLYKDIQVVPVPSQAEFAVVVRTTATTDSGDRLQNLSLALDPSTVVAVDVTVLVPGSKRSDGTIRSRVVWESSVANAQVEAQSAARSTVDGFLWELSKLKETANTKRK